MAQNTIATLPSPIVADDRYKTVSPRLVAYIIDALLIFTPLWVVGNWVTQRADTLLIPWLLTELQRWAPIVYRVVLHGMKGQTVGKMWQHVRVYDLSERPISMMQAMLRDIIPIVISVAGTVVTLVAVGPMLTAPAGSVSAPAWAATWTGVAGYISYAWLAAEIAVMLLNTKHRAVHDLIARSVVLKMDVETENAGAPRARKAAATSPAVWALIAAATALIMPILGVIDGEVCPGYRVDLLGYYLKLIPLALVAAVLGAVLGALLQRGATGGRKGWATVVVIIGLVGCVLLNLFVAIYPGC